jgi:hypothetical protein
MITPIVLFVNNRRGYSNDTLFPKHFGDVLALSRLGDSANNDWRYDWITSEDSLHNIFNTDIRTLITDDYLVMFSVKPIYCNNSLNVG